MNRILLFALLIFMVSCGPQHKLHKTYIGQPVSTMEAEYGKAKSVFDKTGETLYIFEKTKNLESTEISQHKLTLDPMVTPEVKKIMIYYVTVKDGIITDIKLENEYERKEPSRN